MELKMGVKYKQNNIGFTENWKILSASYISHGIKVQKSALAFATGQNPISLKIEVTVIRIDSNVRGSIVSKIINTLNASVSLI